MCFVMCSGETAVSGAERFLHFTLLIIFISVQVEKNREVWYNKATRTLFFDSRGQ